MKYEALPTPITDKVLQMFKFKTKEGILYNDVITQGGKEIMETIIGREAPDGSGRKRVQIEAHTRYGKSLAVAAGISVRATAKKEPWAVVAPTVDKAQIIMDYVIDFVVEDPILSACLVFDRGETLQLLKQHRAKDRLTFKLGGEIRTFGAGVKKSSGQSAGDAIMGFGAANVIEDECYLITDNVHSKVMRMLGDQTDNFLVKIGNPWNRGHGYKSRNNEDYFKMIIDYERGLKEGRLTKEYVEEMRKEPNFSVLYECIPPDEDAMEDGGWLPLLKEKALRAAFITENEIAGWGLKRLGNDIADQGADSSASVLRWENVAKLVFHMRNTGPIGMADQIAILNASLRPNVIMIDRVGVGAGTYEKLHKASGGIEEITKGVNTGEASPSKDFHNMKAWLAWEFKKWIEAGGKLIYDEKWLEILTVKYRVTESKVEVMSKKERRRNLMPSPDAFEALCLTFYPIVEYHIPAGTPMKPGSTPDGAPRPQNPVDNFGTGDAFNDAGAQPYYPDIGI